MAKGVVADGSPDVLPILNRNTCCVANHGFSSSSMVHGGRIDYPVCAFYHGILRNGRRDGVDALESCAALGERHDEADLKSFGGVKL